MPNKGFAQRFKCCVNATRHRWYKCSRNPIWFNSFLPSQTKGLVLNCWKAVWWHQSSWLWLICPDQSMHRRNIQNQWVHPLNPRCKHRIPILVFYADTTFVDICPKTLNVASCQIQKILKLSVSMAWCRQCIADFSAETVWLCHNLWRHPFKATH